MPATDGSGNGGKSGVQQAWFRIIEPVANDVVRPSDDPASVKIWTSGIAATPDGAVVLALSSVLVSPAGSARLGATLVRWTGDGGSVALNPTSTFPNGGFLYPNPVALGPGGATIMGSYGPGGASVRMFRWTAASGVADGGGGVNLYPLSLNGATENGAAVGSSDGQAVYWAPDATSLTGLGFAAGDAQSTGNGLSRDGSVVFGATGTTPVFRPFRWTRQTGLVALPLAAGARACTPDSKVGVAGGGGAVMGTCNTSDGATFLFRWTQEAGTVALGEGSAFPRAISDDGQVIVANRTGNGGVFRWTPASGIVSLPLPTGCDAASALDRLAGGPLPTGMSRDGTVIVGNASGPSVPRVGVRWTVGGAVALPPLPGHNTSVVTSVSVDGTVVAGLSYSQGAAPNDVEAVTWDAEGHVHSVRGALNQAGVDPGGFHLGGVAFKVLLFGDGHVVMGQGTTTAGEERAWIARLPS
jgi:uncharacterized membrane protein